MGLSLYDTWSALVTRTDGVFFVSYGNTPEKNFHAEILKSKPKLVLDLTALLTLSGLNILEKLNSIVSGITVPSSVFDELNNALMEDFSDTAPSMETWKEGDSYYRRDVTPEALESRRSFLEGFEITLRQRLILFPAVWVWL